MALKRLLLSVALVAASAAGALAFELKSPAFSNGGTIAEKHVYQGFGCSGGNLSPALSWNDPPAGTKSFALTVYDPGAPSGGFWHWIVYNIPATAKGLLEGVGKDGKGLPDGAAEMVNDWGKPGYGGPCPPKGDKPHRYRFTLYALKTERLEIAPKATASLAGYLINANALDNATLTGVFGR